MSKKWLDGYTGQTTAELLALADQYRIDSLVVAFEEGLGRKVQLSPEEAVVLAVEEMERQVNNGGFLQFFFNSSEYALQLPTALDKIGCPLTAELARAALEILGVAAEGDIQEAANRIDESQFDAIDQRYFEAAEDIEGSLFDYIARNQARIILP